MKKQWNLTQELLEELLAWLHPDRDQAGLEYEVLRRRLIKLFTCRRCHEPEDLADETINRVATKVKDIKADFVGPRAAYFFAVAQKVHLESLRARPTPVLPPPQNNTEQIELEYACLEKCMQQQTALNRQLVLEYYRGEKRVKIDHRKSLAQQYGIAVNALRIRAHRLRAALQDCVQNCVSQTSS